MADSARRAVHSPPVRRAPPAERPMPTPPTRPTTVMEKARPPGTQPADLSGKDGSEQAPDQGMQRLQRGVDQDRSTWSGRLDIAPAVPEVLPGRPCRPTVPA